MNIKTLVNFVQHFNGFVCCGASLNKGKNTLSIRYRPRKRSLPICSVCGQKRPGFDTLRQRRFQHVPLWGLTVYIVYRMRRVDCPRCGVKVEAVPWGSGKRRMTNAFSLFLAHWARRLSWQEVAQQFGTTWNRVYESVQYVVEYGLKHRVISEVRAIGVDEIQFGKGHQYLTLVYRIDAGARQLLYIGSKRTTKSLLRFFHNMGRSWCSGIQYVCSDMWKPYLKVIAKKLPQAVHVLDRFHIVAKLNEAVDEVRRAEVRRLKAEGYENILARLKYCFLKRKGNHTVQQKRSLKEVLQYDLRSVRAYLLKESFELFWEYTSVSWAQWFLRKWCTRVMRSKLEPMKKFVGTLRRHEELILNWFRAQKEYSSGVVEGLNRKVNLVTRRSYGFRSQKALEVALYHTLGGLPEPELTHRFW